MKCRRCKKHINNYQLSIGLLQFYDNKLYYNKCHESTFPVFMQHYKNYPLILNVRNTKNEILMNEHLIGQNRLMLRKQLEQTEIDNVNFLVSSINWCSGFMNIRNNEQCFLNIQNLIWHLQPKFIILYDNKDKILQKKLNKFLKQNKIIHKYLVHPEKLIKHGATWHPRYFEQIQLLKELLCVKK
jgi:hypothetical protein